MSIFLIRHMLMMAIHQCSAELKISCYLNKGYTYNMNFCKSLFFFTGKHHSKTKKMDEFFNAMKISWPCISFLTQLLIYL